MIVEKLVSGIIPRKDQWDNKAELVNNHLKEMCKYANMDFIDNDKNFNPKKTLNNSKLHLNDKGSYKLSNMLVNYISSIYKLLLLLFKVDFYITFYNYKKPINVNLPRKLEKNSNTKRFANSLI